MASLNLQDTGLPQVEYISKYGITVSGARTMWTLQHETASSSFEVFTYVYSTLLQMFRLLASLRSKLVTRRTDMMIK